MTFREFLNQQLNENRINDKTVLIIKTKDPETPPKSAVL